MRMGFLKVFVTLIVNRAGVRGVEVRGVEGALPYRVPE